MPLRGAAAKKKANADAERLAKIYHAMGEPTRVKILGVVSDAGEEGICSGDIQAEVNKSQPVTSHHLAILVDAGLITGEKQGNRKIYRFDQKGLAALLQETATRFIPGRATPDAPEAKVSTKKKH